MTTSPENPEPKVKSAETDLPNPVLESGASAGKKSLDEIYKFLETYDREKTTPNSFTTSDNSGHSQTSKQPGELGAERSGPSEQLRRALSNTRDFAYGRHLETPVTEPLTVGGLNLRGPFRLHEVQIGDDPKANKAGKEGLAIDVPTTTGARPPIEYVMADVPAVAKDAVRPAAQPEIAANGSQELKYPNGESAIVGRENGQANDVVFRDKSGQEISHYVKKGDEWFSQTRDGMRAKLEGRIEVSGKGDIALEVEANTWKTLKTDGQVQMERANADGSRVGFTKDGLPNHVVRKDRSAVEVDYSGKEPSAFREYDAAGKLTTSWTKNGDKWSGSPASQEQRKNMSLATNGNYQYESSDGFKYTVTGDSGKVIDDLGVNVTRDAQGRVQEIRYPGGQKTRTFGRDEKGDVNSIVTSDQNGKVTLTKDGGKWLMQMGSMPPIPFPGDVKVSGNNDISFEVKSGTWMTEKPNGSSVVEKAGPGGSRVSKDQTGNVDQITRPDGSVVEGRYRDGKLYQVTEYSADSRQKTSWVDKGGGNFESVPPTGEVRQNIKMFDTGLTLWEGQNGTKQGKLGDGRDVMEKPGQAKFTFNDKGHIDSITYVSGEQVRFGHYDNGQIKEVSQWKDGRMLRTQVRDGEGSNSWTAKDAAGRAVGKWSGDYQVTPDGTLRHKDNSAKNKDGAWTVVKPDGVNYREVVNADGSRRLTKPDKSFVEIDRQGMVRRMGTSKDNYRLLDYENGQLTKVYDYRKGKAAGVWEPQKDENIRDLKVTDTGDITYRTKDGGAVIGKSNLSAVMLEKEGYMTRVVQPDGTSRTFDYRPNGEGQKILASITDIRRGENGQGKIEKWMHELDANGKPTNNFYTEGRDGKKTYRKDVEVGRDGDYEYKANDGKLRVAKAGRDNSGGMSENVDEARDRLMEAMESHMDQPRRARMAAMMKQFETRAQTRIEDQVLAKQDREKVEAEWSKKVAGTYDHLYEMTKEHGSKAPYDMAMRTKLIENALLFSMEPTKNNQGGHGTCWIEGPINLIGWTNNPDKMARLVSQVSTTGTFTPVEGTNKSKGSPKTYAIAAGQLKLDGEARNWTIGNGMQSIARSPIGQICDHTLSFIGGRKDGGTNGGTWESFTTTGNRWYYGSQELLRMATGDTAKLVRIGSNNLTGHDVSKLTGSGLKDEMLKKGGVVLVGPGHIFAAKMVHQNGKRVIVGDNQWGPDNDQKIGTVNDVASWSVRTGRERYKPEMPGSLKVASDDHRRNDGNNNNNRSRPRFYGPSPVYRSSGPEAQS